MIKMDGKFFKSPRYIHSVSCDDEDDKMFEEMEEAIQELD